MKGRAGERTAVRRSSVTIGSRVSNLLRGRTYFICPKRRTVFAAIPKAGVESLRLLILEEEREPDPQEIWSARFDRYILRSRGDFPEDYAYLVIVRNPFTRLVSGYLDKFLTGNFHLLPFCRRAMRWHGRRMDDPRRLNFEEFVRFLVVQPNDGVDPHFRRQTALFHMNDRAELFRLEEGTVQARLRTLGFEHPFRNFREHHLYSLRKTHLENAHQTYYDGFDIAERRTGPVDPPHAAGIGFQGAVVPFYGDFYTDELRRLVHGYYGEDFSALGYSERSLPEKERA